MKATAFAPGHISGFFEPVYNKRDMSRTGSRGAGINISFGAYSEVNVSNSQNQSFEIFINRRKTKAPVTNLALKYLISNTPLNVKVKTKLDLPMGQGFGMSGAGALSATLALSKMINLSAHDAMRASHFAEIQLRTGLGDVIASSFGGVEIRKSPGLPPWGIIEHIPGKFDLILCVIGKKVDTKKILSNPSKASRIVEYGKICTKQILENPSIENLFSLSKMFTQKTELADPKVINAINAANGFGMASMCMLGNSVFAAGKTDDLTRIFSSFGKVFVCSVNESGARILQEKAETFL